MMPLNLPTLETKDQVESLRLQELLVALKKDLQIVLTLTMYLEALQKSQVSKLRLRVKKRIQPPLYTIAIVQTPEL